MKTTFLFVVAALLCALSSFASADRVEMLIGSRHFYSYTYPDRYESQRQSIEERYVSTKVDAQSDLDNGLITSEDYNTLLAIAASRRDSAMDRYYTRCDELRGQYTDLQIDEDCAYQPVCIERSSSLVIVQVILYEPYRGYRGRSLYGLDYGVHPYKKFRTEVQTYNRNSGRRTQQEVDPPKSQQNGFNRDAGTNIPKPPAPGKPKDKTQTNPTNGIRQPNQNGHPKGNDKSGTSKQSQPDKGKKDDSKDKHHH